MESAAEEQKLSSAPENDKNWKEMIASPIFYVMLLMLFFGAVLGMMAISQASGIAQNMVGLSAEKPR